MIRIGESAFGALACVLVASGTVVVAAQSQQQRITFSHGASSAVVNGQIKGYQSVDYLLNARAGQVLNIGLSTRHGATYFNLIEPGQTDVAVHIGSIAGNQFEGAAAKSGDYRIRVYMMRSAARRGEVASYRLETKIAGATQLPLQPGDALVPGTDFHATGSIVCDFGRMKSARCEFGVKREGQGKAMVTITRPDGSKRVVFFEGGKATGYDKSQADSAAFSVSRHDDVSVVRIGSETYQIFDAVVFGG